MPIPPPRRGNRSLSSLSPSPTATTSSCSPTCPFDACPSYRCFSAKCANPASAGRCARAFIATRCTRPASLTIQFSRIERGRREVRLETLLRLPRALEVSLNKAAGGPRVARRELLLGRKARVLNHPRITGSQVERRVRAARLRQADRRGVAAPVDLVGICDVVALLVRQPIDPQGRDNPSARSLRRRGWPSAYE